MSQNLIVKPRPGHGPAPNLVDYQAARTTFSWSRAAEGLDGRVAGRLNMAHEAVDRHAAGARRDHLALRWLPRAGEPQDYSYGQLQELTDRFATLLAELGVAKGEVVAVLLGRVPALYVAALGTLKHGAVLCPLYAAFGPQPLCTRLSLGGARVLVTNAALYRRKLADHRSRLPGLRHVLLADEDDAASPLPATAALWSLLRQADPVPAQVTTGAEDIALLHYTSGTTGMPKGAMHAHAAVLVQQVSARLALDIHPEDVFWCTADPGWVTGTSYGIMAPLTLGATLLCDEAEFEPVRWLSTLRGERVNVWYTSPTAVRMMMRLAAELPARAPFPDLRFIASVGEPLNPEAVHWSQKAFGLPIHDNWWQTETGAIMIANFAALPIKPGSMGLPLPGVEASLLRRGPHRSVTPVTQADVEGELAIRASCPSLFRGYLGEPERYAECFADGWYLTGDIARRDADGYFWFLGRADDVILSSGHLIGPFEVESALLEHPAVGEAGAIGVPDALATERVKAFVTLKSGWQAGEALRQELLAHARRRLGAVVAPKEVEFRVELPKTRSGKIVRRLLKAWELGLPEGDLSGVMVDPAASLTEDPPRHE